MADEQKLKLCPFCGGEARMVASGVSDDLDFPLFKIECQRCHASSAPVDSRAYARKLWNNREEDNSLRSFVRNNFDITMDLLGRAYELEQAIEDLRRNIDD